MSNNNIITENELDIWVRGHARDAQGVIVELVYRLVAASSPRPRERRFPLGDSIGQPGPDGELFTDLNFEPFVPEGRSYWEIGTGIQAGAKATSDYRDLTKATPASVRRNSVFIFVTPLSGTRTWQYTWEAKAQAKWLKEWRERNEWRDVRVIDGTRLIDWLDHFPAVQKWLADLMGLPAQQMHTPEEYWKNLKTIGAPPPLAPQVFLVNREAACEKLKELFSRTTLQVKLETHFPDQPADFVAAYVAAMDDDTKVDTVGRCLIISGADGWNAVTNLPEPHVLVPDFHIDEADSAGTRLLERGRRSGHAVIFSGMPGGVPHPNRVTIPNPKSYQLKEALVKSGYNEERARILAQKSNGNLSSLLRCLQNLSLMPEWAQGTDAAELAIAEILGAWRDDSEADKAIAEKLSKKHYGEWIGKMREIQLRPGTPLIFRNSVWNVISRYEGWYALGPRIFDEHLDRLNEAAVTVLRERDPQFELSRDKRYAASIHGKVLTHSHLLRNGLAESLALLGSHPKALSSCSLGKAESVAVLSVRQILANADWMLWASLNDVLPLFAEAAPEELLDAVENALNSDPCPFDALFAEEGDGIMGGNYLTGLLWAMETLAWGSQYLTRVIVILGQLATRDPGGTWANRPANSLSTILLPWLPQTCASVGKRKTAVQTLIREVPDVGWKLLLSLLPELRQVSLGSRKPTWRKMIADEWSKVVTQGEYWEQISIYAELAITMAKSDLSKLVDLINRLDDLPLPARDRFLAHLDSEATVSMPESDIYLLWSELLDLVTKHRKFADAKWAMKQEEVDKISSVAERLSPDSPDIHHRRLFSERDFDLFDEKGKWKEQQKELEERRDKAIDEIFAGGGVQAVVEFAKAVESPWRVGIGFGVVADKNCDRAILPDLLDTENKSLTQFAGGFVWGRFQAGGWEWVDDIDTSNWNPTQTGQLLAYLPFKLETWTRSTRLLVEDESAYWTKTNVNPQGAEKDLELAVESLIKHGRPRAAITCLHRMQYEKQPFNSNLAIRALLTALESTEPPQTINAYELVGVIKALQDDPGINPNELFRLEWAYLPILDGHQGAYPKLLQMRLADDPDFFCEVIRTIFRSKIEKQPTEEPTEQQKNIANNAYRLLQQWKTPPGWQKNGTYNGEVLNAWLKRVKTACAETGHMEIAMIMVGHVLIYAPADPDGLWIHHSVAGVLNEKDANNLREGFQTELFNSRGVYGFTAGREELQFAKKYKKQAEEVEAQGYHRLANTLRKLASTYEHIAEREAARDSFDD